MKDKFPGGAFKLADVAGRVLMIDRGGDDYGDNPKREGTRAEALACGVIPTSAGSKTR